MFHGNIHSIYTYICACPVLKWGKKERRQKRKNEEGITKERKENKRAIYIERLSDEAKTGLPKSNL